MSDPNQTFRAARRAMVLALVGGMAPAMAQETTWEFLANFDRPFIGRETAKKIILVVVAANSDPREFLADETAVDVADMGAAWRVTIKNKVTDSNFAKLGGTSLTYAISKTNGRIEGTR